jgi:hypothetical protein
LAADFYVSPGASATGTGSFSNPWRLQTALNHPAAVHPGDTIWLRGGTYAGNFINALTGTSSQPIIVRAYPGERATLDGGAYQSRPVLKTGGAYTWFWGLEIMSSDPDRVSTQDTSWPTDMNRGDGVDDDGVTASPGLKFINLIVHDNANGFGAFATWTNTEIYGCLVYYNGWNGPDGGHGHGIYAQNQTPGTKSIADNIVFQSFSHGLHVYTENGYIDNFIVDGNAFMMNGDIASSGSGRNLLLGGARIAANPIVRSNMLYFPSGAGPSSSLDLGYSAGCSGPTVQNNYVADNSYVINCANPAMTGNTFYGSVVGFTPSSYPSNTYLSTRPTGTRVFVRPNAFEAGRAHVVIYNWDRLSTVPVDLSGVLSPGSGFVVRNAQHYYGAPVVQGIYAGGTVNIPLTGLTVAPPVGVAPPAPTGLDFNAFVVEPASAVGTPTPTVPAATSTPTRTPTPPPPTATRTPTPPPPTATRTPTLPPPTATRTPTLPPPTPTPTPTTVPPTATRTNTSVPPTATRTPTGVPPTATRTPTGVPPTATRTPTGVPPTATRTPTGVPPTATRTPTRTATAPPPTATRTPIPPPPPTPTPTGRVLLTREAESAALVSPMIAVNDTTALLGKHISSATANAGTASWSFTAPGGNYVIWARVLAPTSSADSFFVRMDAGAEDIYDVAEGTQGPNWQWTRINGRNGTAIPLTLNPRTFALSSGTHTLVFRGREAGTKVDRIVITNDLAYTPATGNSVTFSDVPVGHPFYEFIETIARNGLASGCGGGKFCPDATTTRAQMAVYLLRARHGSAYNPPPATGAVFSDVSAGSFAAAWIEQLAAEGLTTGCGGGRFCPGSNVSRDQLSVFLLRSRLGTGFQPPAPSGLFNDVPVGNGFAPWIEELYNRQVTGGCAPLLYCPSSGATRGQIAVMLTAGFGLS